jgi:poly(3-hydroxybutyrate) depolymerase
MLRKTILLATLWLFTTIVSAQTLPSGPQVLTFFSDLDDTEQPYGLYLPPNYDAKKKYPLVIMLHGAGSNHRLALRRVFGKSNANGETDVEATRYFPEWKDVDFIVASPYARGTVGYQGIAEKDVYDVLADVKKRFSIDEDRTYLTGLSMGGGGTLWIGLTRPDIWAAIAPVCPAPPNGTDTYAANSFNLPVHFFHGDKDEAVPVTVSRDWVKRMKDIGTRVEYVEYPGVGHNSWENAYQDEAIFKWFSQFKRNTHPDEVKFSTAQYKYNKAYWVRVDHLTPGLPATVTAKFTGDNQLQITTENTTAVILTLANHPRYSAAKPLQVVLNGKKVKTTMQDSLHLTIKDGKWTQGKPAPGGLIKKAGAEGPLREAFAQRHVYVFGTQDNPSEDELKKRMAVATEAANWSFYRNAFLGRIMFFPRVLADREVRPSDIESSNLILFGTKETNSVIGKYADRLPIHLPADKKDLSLFYIFPIDGRYVVVNSGLPWWTNAETPGFRFLPQPLLQLNSLKDFVLFKDSAKNVLAEGYFNNSWTIDDEQKKKLTAAGALIR